MDPVRLEWVKAVTGARRADNGRERLITGVTTDSRRVEAGQLFFALSGENFDGRDFIEDAFAKGAAAAVVDARPGDEEREWPGPVLLVEDVRQALVELARAYRKTLKATIVGVTGSVGKTTVKDMLFAALEGEKAVVKAQASYNNIIGVPLTLLSASRSSEVVIVEVGTNGPGEIDFLADIVKPDIAIITAIGYSHLAGLNSLAGVTHEKSALLKHLKPGGLAVLNGDDVRCRAMAAVHRDIHGAESAVTVGFNEDCDWCGDVIALMTAEAGSRARMRVWGGVEVALAVPGLHNLRNALTAYAVAVECGASGEGVARNLARFKPTPGRLNVIRANLTAILDDCYNANPTSTKASLECFTLFASQRRRFAVLGSMLELGEQSADFHRALGRLVVRYGLDGLVTVGDDARLIGLEAIRLGFDPERVEHFNHASKVSFSALLDEAPGGAVLVKGSRGVGLEVVVSELCQRSTRSKSVA